MLPDTPSVSQLSHVISPSGRARVSSWCAGGLHRGSDFSPEQDHRSIYLNQISNEDEVRCRLKADLPRLVRRAAMINRAIFWAIMGSISISVVIVVGFVSAFFQIQHERGVAILFIVSVAAFIVSLVDFAREVRIALSEFDHYG